MDVFPLDNYTFTFVCAFLFMAWLLLLLLTSKTAWIFSILLTAAVVIIWMIVSDISVLESIALSSLPVIGLTFIFATARNIEEIIVRENRLCPNYFFIGLVVLTVISVSMSLVGSTNIVNDLFLQIYTLFSYFSPAIMFVIIFFVFFRSLSRLVKSLFRTERIWSMISSVAYIQSGTTRPYPYLRYSTSRNLAFLVTFIFVSISFASLPYLGLEVRDFNTREESVSVDIVHYANWLDDLKNSTNIDQFLVKAFNEINGGDRPLSLVLLYPFVLVSPDSLL